jgi:hypothetical protein
MLRPLCFTWVLVWFISAPVGAVSCPRRVRALPVLAACLQEHRELVARRISHSGVWCFLSKLGDPTRRPRCERSYDALGRRMMRFAVSCYPRNPPAAIYPCRVQYLTHDPA